MTFFFIVINTDFYAELFILIIVLMIINLFSFGGPCQNFLKKTANKILSSTLVKINFLKGKSSGSLYYIYICVCILSVTYLIISTS